MASRILSVTPAFLRPTSESVFRSNFEGVDLILAITTASGRPPLTIWITESLVSSSWAIEMAPGIDTPRATTRTTVRSTRIIFMRPPGKRGLIRTGRDHPGDRADRSTKLGYFRRSVNSASRPASPDQRPRRREHGQEREGPVHGHGGRHPEPAGQEADPERA